MLNTDVKVPLPDKGIVKVRAGDKTYVQYTVSAYRNEAEKLTSRRVVIGKFDEQSDMLIPNRNYYEIYMGQPSHLSDTLNVIGKLSDDRFMKMSQKYDDEQKLHPKKRNWKKVRRISCWMSL